MKKIMTIFGVILFAPTPPTLIALVGFVGLHAARASVIYMVGAAM